MTSSLSSCSRDWFGDEEVLEEEVIDGVIVGLIVGDVVGFMQTFFAI